MRTTAEMRQSVIYVRHARQTLALTQAEFARRIGVNGWTVNRWENGHAVPLLMARNRIAELLATHEAALREGLA